MKRYLLLIIAAICIGCTSEDDVQPKNKLEGTAWWSEYNNGYLEMRFKDATNMSLGRVSKEGIYLDYGIFNGTYTLNGDNVNMSLTIPQGTYGYPGGYDMKSAVISGNTMTVSFMCYSVELEDTYTLKYGE